MQVNPPPIDPLPKVDIGELLLETVKNAPILPVSLMDAVAKYVEFQSKPVMTLSGMDVRIDPTLKDGEFRFDHSDGRKDKFNIFSRGKK